MARNDVISTPTIDRTEIIKATCRVIDSKDLKKGLNDSSIFFDLKKLSNTFIDLLIILKPKNRNNIPRIIFGEYSTMRLNKKL